MYIVLEKDTKKAVVMLPEDDDVILDEKNLTSRRLIVSDISSTTHDLVIGLPPEPPIYWVAGALRYLDGVWEVSDQSIYDAYMPAASALYQDKLTKHIDALRQAKKDRLNQIHDEKLKGSIVVSGMRISMDTDSKAIMALAKTNSRASRKVYTKAGDRAILTAAQFDGLVATIENYGQDLMNKAYGTSAALDAATTVEELNAIDVEAGWPQ